MKNLLLSVILVPVLIPQFVEAQNTQSGKAMVEESWQAQSGSFVAMLLLTCHPQEAMAAWAQPPREGYVPQVRTSSTVARGEVIAALVVFSGCQAGEDGFANVEADLVVLKPDGSEYASLPKSPLWKDKAALPSGQLQLGDGMLAVIIEPEDPLGRYTVKAQVRDVVANRVVNLENSFVAVEAPAVLEIDSFIPEYYRNPRPQLIAEAIRTVGERGMVSDPRAQPPLVAFFAVVFSQNEDLLASWREIIEDQDGTTRSVFDESLRLAENPQALLGKMEPSPSLNDMLWGAYYASGDLVYVRMIAKNLAYLPEREDRNLFTTGASAQWSLASHVRSHAEVRQAVIEMRANADDQIRDALRETIDLDPSEIQRRVVAVMREQSEKGVW